MSLHDALNDAKDETNEKHSIVRQEILNEYYFLENIIDKFDDKALKIKSWSITASGVAIAFGYTEGQARLFLLASLGSLVFWYLESLWKVYQEISVSRVKELEKILHSNIYSYSGPRIAEKYTAAFDNGIEAKRLIRTMWYSNVWAPHFFIFLLGLILYLRA